MKKLVSKGGGARPGVLLHGALLVESVGFYVLMEWLFFVTKGSFMDSLSWLSKWGALFIPVLLLSLISWVLSLVIDRVLKPKNVRWFDPLVLLPVFWFVATFFLLIDNFIYSILKVGVVNSGGWGRLTYSLLLVWLFRRSVHLVEVHLERIRHHGLPPWRRRLALTVLSLGASMAVLEWTSTSWTNWRPEAVTAKIRRPNIVFVAADGLEAEVLSAYGYPIPTTPFLSSFSREMMFFENAFAPAAKTTGSTSALLSGILPTRSKLGYPPQVMPKALAYRHLPAILRANGYTGFQQSIRHYADSADMNMQGGFERANGRTVALADAGPLMQPLIYVFNAEIQFAFQLYERLASRLLHILGVRPMLDPFQMVKVNRGLGPEEDRKTIRDAIRFIDEAGDRPFFMHLHLMSTHCCTYEGGGAHFQEVQIPAGSEMSGERRRQLLGRLNLIRDADSRIEELVDHLRMKGLLDETIVVVSSDHSAEWSSLYRLPLMIRFPRGENRGRVVRNTSFVDVAPTLLEYVGLPVPDWMDGRSVFSTLSKSELRTGKAAGRPIFTVDQFQYRQFKLKGLGGHLSQMTNPGPPLFGFGKVALIQCHLWRRLDLLSGKLDSGVIRGHTDPCPESGLVSDDAARTLLLEHLRSEGFVISFGKNEV